MSAAPGRGIFGIPLDAQPTDGGIGVTLAFDFTGGAIVSTGDLTLEQMSGAIGFVQSCYIDNSLSTKPLSITVAGTLQTITIKAGQQGYFPLVPFTGTFSWSATCGAVSAAVKVPVIFMNIKLAAATVWQAV